MCSVPRLLTKMVSLVACRSLHVYAKGNGGRGQETSRPRCEIQIPTPFPFPAYYLPPTHAQSSRCQFACALRRNRSNGSRLSFQLPDLVRGGPRGTDALAWLRLQKHGSRRRHLHGCRRRALPLPLPCALRRIADHPHAYPGSENACPEICLRDLPPARSKTSRHWRYYACHHQPRRPRQTFSGEIQSCVSCAGPCNSQPEH